MFLKVEIDGQEVRISLQRAERENRKRGRTEKGGRTEKERERGETIVNYCKLGWYSSRLQNFESHSMRIANEFFQNFMTNMSMNSWSVMHPKLPGILIK